MEILLEISFFLLLVGLIVSPIILLSKINKSEIKFKFIIYLTLGLIITAIIIFIIAWWSYTSDLILIKHYGYNIDGMNEVEFYGNVLPENLEEVKSLEKSIMGIGWTLKAILTFTFFSPYLLIIYLINFLISKLKKSKLEIQTENEY
jgi:hypothetical protein